MGFWSSNSNDKNGSSTSNQSIRDQEADAELAELIAAFTQEPSPSSKDGNKRHGRDRGEIDNNTAYTSTFPGEMNCITAFDEMFYCYSMGGQFLNGVSSLFPNDGIRLGIIGSGFGRLIPQRKCIDMVDFGTVARRARIGDSV